MASQLICIEVNLRDSPASLEQAIEAELKQRGHPIRWVVLDVDLERQTVYVEALILVAD